MGGFADPAVRERAAAKSLETRRAKAEARHQELETRRAMATPPVHAPAPASASPGMREVQEGLAKAASGLPALDNMFEVPEARRADALDIKLAGMRANTGKSGTLGRDAVRRVSTVNDLTNEARAFGNESRPAQLQSLTVDSSEPGKIIVYDDNFQARAIPEQNFRAVLKTGKLHYSCPGCGDEHLKEVITGYNRMNEPVVQTVVDFDQDACPSRPKVMKLRCPECRKRGNDMVFYDTPPEYQGGSALDTSGDDSMFMNLVPLSDSDPKEAAKQRLTMMWHEHMAWVHPVESRAYNIDVAAIRQATTIGASENTALIH